MSGLRDTQQRLISAILQRREHAADPGIVRPGGAGGLRRIAIYRVNTRENFALALEAAFPVLSKRMGSGEFRSLAWSFQLSNPSRSGNLFEIGRNLPEFLTQRLTGAAKEPHADLARLEWAVQEAMVASNSEERVHPVALAALPSSAHARLNLHLHPAVRVLRLEHAVLECWQQHQMGASTLVPIERRPEHLLVRRAKQGIEIHRLDPFDCHCLTLVAAGATLGTLADAVVAGDMQGDLTRTLRHWVKAGVINRVEAS